MLRALAELAMDKLVDHESPSFKVVFPDNKSKQFGYGEPQFSIHYHTWPTLAKSFAPESSGLAHGFATGDIEIEGDLENALMILADFKRGSLKRLRPILKSLLGRGPLQKVNGDRILGGNAFFRLYTHEDSGIAPLQHSCGYFKTPEDSLELALEQMIDYTLRKLHLQPGLKLLDLGCAWGDLLLRAGENFRMDCLGITNGTFHAHHLKNLSRERKLRTEFGAMEIRDFPEIQKWDRVVSVGLVGYHDTKDTDSLLQKVSHLLSPNGIFVLHTMSLSPDVRGTDEFLEGHLVPGYWPGNLETVSALARNHGLFVLDVENLQRHYAQTITRWRANLLQDYRAIRMQTQLSSTLLRAWNFCLAQAAIEFRSGQVEFLQWVISKDPGSGYPMTRDFLYT